MQLICRRCQDLPSLLAPVAATQGALDPLGALDAELMPTQPVSHHLGCCTSALLLQSADGALQWQRCAVVQENQGSSCAAAVLIGIDVSPEPGLRGPTNFAGLCGPALLVELETVLSAAGDKYRSLSLLPHDLMADVITLGQQQQTLKAGLSCGTKIKIQLQFALGLLPPSP